MLRDLFGINLANTIWFYMVWVFLRWRNKVFFKKENWNKEIIVDVIKGRLWSWCRSKEDIDFYRSFREWLMVPRVFKSIFNYFLLFWINWVHSVPGLLFLLIIPFSDQKKYL